MHSVQHTQIISNGTVQYSILYIQTTLQSYGRGVVKNKCANHAVKYYCSRLD